MEPIQIVKEHYDEIDDSLNKSFKSIIPGLALRWDSVVSQCPSSGTILHMLSLSRIGANNDRQKKSSYYSLLGITRNSGSEPQNGGAQEGAITAFRSLLATHIQNRVSAIQIKHLFSGGNLQVTDILGKKSCGLPLLDLPMPNSRVENLSVPENNLKRQNLSEYGLKEITIPTYDYAVYGDDRSSLLSKLSRSPVFDRPVTGLYQCRGTYTTLRPLPTSAQDQVLPPTSLIFHCSNISQDKPILPNHDNVVIHGISTAKIGYSGTGHSGQLLVRHKDLVGLDVRLCSSTKLSSTFAEAQESLLAGSLHDLQSTNTLTSGNEDNRLGQADCWVEVRANLRNPSGFWRQQQQQQTASTKNNVARAPNLPPE